VPVSPELFASSFFPPFFFFEVGLRRALKTRSSALPQQTEKNEGHRKKPKINKKGAHWKAKIGSRRENKKNEKNQKGPKKCGAS
jgi:hypothetical protein